MTDEFALKEQNEARKRASMSNLKIAQAVQQEARERKNLIALGIDPEKDSSTSSQVGGLFAKPQDFMTTNRPQQTGFTIEPVTKESVQPEVKLQRREEASTLGTIMTMVGSVFIMAGVAMVIDMVGQAVRILTSPPPQVQPPPQEKVIEVAPVVAAAVEEEKAPQFDIFQKVTPPQFNIFK